ncbi:F-box associated ubiquitination effector family protein [Euphorbia peplus]|nr:F-box associated ubiquitination effector family protein [Euphorbia peplus]
MKRKKISETCGEKSRNDQEAEAGRVEIQHSGSSIINLPSHVLAAILFRLPIKEIIACKCACKSLYAKISDPDFGRYEVIPIARAVDEKNLSRILYPLEIDQDGRSMMMFLHFAPGCTDPFEHYHLHMEFNTMLKIPVRNFPMVLRDTINGNEEIALKAKDHGYTVVNSCNGFLCLSESFHGKPVVVSNPITGEFINLPRITSVVGYEDYVDSGFGYSPKSNQYKVVRIFELSLPLERGYQTIARLAQVHILGSRSWKNIESAPCLDYKLSFPTYLNGAVHWFCHRVDKLSQMVSFDCEKECFLPFSLPPLKDPNKVNVGLGVLEGYLCICDSSTLTSICVWVMKNYGVEKSWTQLFKIDMNRSDKLLYGLYQPIKYLNNGALLMFNYPRGFLVYYDPTKLDLLLLTVCPIGSRFEMLAHTPSFTSFKYLLGGSNVEVLNVYSRCAGLKVKGEAQEVRPSCISLCEKTDYFDFLQEDDPVKSEFYSHEYHSCHQYLEEYWWGNYEYCFSTLGAEPSAI